MAAVRCASRIGVAASVVTNLAFLALYILRRYFSGGGGKEITMVEPSKGKPPVTPDSVVNLTSEPTHLIQHIHLSSSSCSTLSIDRSPLMNSRSIQFSFYLSYSKMNSPRYIHGARTCLFIAEVTQLCTMNFGNGWEIVGRS
jgi:hypothetical protein